MHFCTGPGEQKYRNLEHAPRVALTTGTNTWAQGPRRGRRGHGRAHLRDDDLQRLADAYEAKYGSFWHFDVVDGMFGGGGENLAAVFRIEPDKVMAFAKDPHGQTTYRFGGD